MLGIFWINTLAWTVYGVFKDAIALAVSDAIILALLTVLIAYKVRDIRPVPTPS